MREKGSGGGKEEVKKRSTFKRVNRERSGEGASNPTRGAGRKREAMEIDGGNSSDCDGLKEQKGENKAYKRTKLAGLAVQPCKDQ